MKKILFLTLFLYTHLIAFSQIQYEKGYFIDNENKRTDCLIKNVDWKNNPNRFDYKITENAGKETKSIENVQAFSIQNFSKYVRAVVNMDTSSTNFNNLTHNQSPQYKQMTVFLKILTEGDATLYYYENGNMKRFFMQIKNQEVVPLIYKQYINEKEILTENAQFRQFLINSLKCNKLEFKDFETLKYKEKELVELFEKYNLCVNPNSSTKNVLNKKKTSFNIKASIGVNISSFDFHYLTRFKNEVTHFDTKINPNIGIEIESILPFNKNKWSIFTAPNYHFYKVQFASKSEELVYHAIEIPIDLRYFMYLNQKSRIFINSGITIDWALNKTINIKDYASNILITSSFCLNFGLGYAYNNLVIEFRYYRPKNILDNFLSLYSEFFKSSLILSYKF